MELAEPSADCLIFSPWFERKKRGMALSSFFGTFSGSICGAGSHLEKKDTPTRAKKRLARRYTPPKGGSHYKNVIEYIRGGSNYDR